MSDAQNEHIKKSAKKRKPTAKQVAEIYSKKGTNKTATCAALGICRNTLESWRKNSPRLNELMTEAEESLLDFSESKLVEQIQDGNMTAIIFHLKTKGKKRGYTETVEVEENHTTDLDLSGLSNNELASLMSLLKKAKKSK